MKIVRYSYSIALILSVAMVLSSICVASTVEPSALPPHTYHLLKCNFHTHTTASDGEYTPAQVVNIYKDAGYDVLAITDHDTLAGYAEARAEGDKVGLLVITGEEITDRWSPEPGSWKHILVLFIDEAIPPNADVEIYFDRIHAQNGIGIVAHPWHAWEYWQNYKTANYIDGWEVDSATSQSWDWLYRSSFIYLRNHDFHGDNHVGMLPKYWTYVLAENRTEAGVKEALLARRTVVYEKGELRGSPYALSLFIQNQDIIHLTPETPQEPEPEPQGNLLLNPSVESGGSSPSYWSQYRTSGATGSCQWVNDFHRGQKAVKITLTYNSGTRSTESILWHQSIQASVGETYRLRVWYKSSVQPTILLLAFSNTRSLLRVAWLNLPTSSSWAQSQWLTISVPTGTNTLRADARLFNRATGWAVFDDFELVAG